MPTPQEDVIAQRIAKVAELRARGIDPYPPRFRRTHTCAEARSLADASPDASDPAQGRLVRTAGRVRRLRPMGGRVFLDIQDSTGMVQVSLARDALSPEAFQLARDLDLGDFLGVQGRVFRTKTGEPTIAAEEIVLLTKALRPPPGKWHPLTDVETRHRQRYLDLMMNEETRRVFRLRSSTIAAIRRFLDARGFLEVETPILHAVAGGAAARPFTTHHNALDWDLTLRIATELHLKRLLVGGFERVYEIGRVFRNEGIDTRHNPEFTTLECYEAYADYHDVMALTEELVSTVAQEVLGTTTITYRGERIDLRPPWQRQTLREAVLERTGVDILAYPDAPSLQRAVRERELAVDPNKGWAKLVDDLLTTYVEPQLIQPTFLLDYPVEMTPLAKRKPEDPRLVERFEAYIGGMEIANAFTELNDPLDQRERFRQQALARSQGDEEAEVADEDFLIALEYGMPPAGGLGIGIDRLVMLLSDKPSIREVILFPLLKPRER
jgi:lysyl-tRNA synthetase class 2